MRILTVVLAAASLLTTVTGYWLNEIPHRGYAPFAEPNYPVFRNVKDYGAKGDGSTDDTAAINAAILAGNPCNEGCASTTKTPAIVYFPPGVYLISSSIKPAYFTQLIGDPNERPVLKATSNFQGFGLIDGNPYTNMGHQTWTSVNLFFRQIRNFVIDTRAIPANLPATGIHWPTGQATSLQNIVFEMPTDPNVVHVGLFIENGSGGFMTDLTFNGGNRGAELGNQQYTMRNLRFNNCKTAIYQIWNWGWTYSGLEISNCGIGIDMSDINSEINRLNVGSVTLIDSTFRNTDVAIKTGWGPNTLPSTANSLILENILFESCPVTIQGAGNSILFPGAGGSSQWISAWGIGHGYTTTGGPTYLEGDSIPAAPRPPVLTAPDGRFYTHSKPQYQTLTKDNFLSVRAFGAVGNAQADDTDALQRAIDAAVTQGKVLFLDYGLYRVTWTIQIPPGARIVGESYPVILSSGPFFADMNNPRPVVQVGRYSGQPGRAELVDFIVSTQGRQPGAIGIEWNLASPTNEPSGMWDAHVRIGGFEGTQQQVAECLKQPGSPEVKPQCVVAFMAMHVTEKARGLYMENVWLWTADHDIDDPQNTQITIFTGRGLYIESETGPFWLWGTSSEHHVLYQYQVANTRNIFMGQIQTETPYFMPIPNALVPFPSDACFNDPDFETSCDNVEGNCAASWGLRVVDSRDVLVYGAGLYSFFDNYSTNCSRWETGETCQQRIVSVEGEAENVVVYNLNTIGTREMITRDGQRVAWFADNENTFAQNVAAYWA